jgi:hypothetical protein
MEEVGGCRKPSITRINDEIRGVRDDEGEGGEEEERKREKSSPASKSELFDSSQRRLRFCFVVRKL